MPLSSVHEVHGRLEVVFLGCPQRTWAEVWPAAWEKPLPLLTSVPFAILALRGTVAHQCPEARLSLCANDPAWSPPVLTGFYCHGEQA